MPAAGTGNLLLDLEQVRAHGLRFDERFGLTGGSDTLFTRTLIDRGGRIVWSSAAGLVDKVPAQRLTRKWVLNRQYRFGNTWSRTSLELVDPGPRRLATRARLTVAGGSRFGYGLLRGSLRISHEVDRTSGSGRPGHPPGPWEWSAAPGDRPTRSTAAPPKAGVTGSASVPRRGYRTVRKRSEARREPCPAGGAQGPQSVRDGSCPRLGRGSGVTDDATAAGWARSRTSSNRLPRGASGRVG